MNAGACVRLASSADGQVVLNTMHLIDVGLGGLFAFAAVHYGLQWWFSRKEPVLLAFSAVCALYMAFALSMSSRHSVTTIAESQLVLDRSVTLAMLAHAAQIQLYAYLAKRRDRVFRALLTGVFFILAALNLWLPLRGTVVAMQTIAMPGGGTGLLPVRTAPGVLLPVMYFAGLMVVAYGFVAARTIWKRDRRGALLLVLGMLACCAAWAMAVLIDFANLRALYLGASPIAFLVLCMAFFLAREYSARAAREAVANRQFETAFEHAPIGKALFAANGQVLRVNRALCSFLGASADELCTRHLQDFTRPDDGAPGELDARLLAGEIPTYTVEKSIVRTNGELAWALLAVSLVPDEHGRPARILAQLQDVTELRAHRDRLEELVAMRTSELRDAKDVADRANATKSQFLAQMSHEIRTPLGVIMLYAQLLQRDRALGEPQRKKIDSIFKSVKHLTKVLTDVLEMSKIEAGHIELVEDRFDPWLTLADVQQMFALQSESNGIELTLEIAADLPHSLLGDAGKVKQILINLVSNAVKFTERGGIRIEASASALAADELTMKVVVADTGVGIARQDLDRLFQPFEQLRDGARAGGTGLGLAISLAHARLMRGDLTVESTLGSGTTFTATFRTKGLRQSTAVERSDAPLSVALPVSYCKVLIVDDQQSNREVLAELLSHPRFETRTVADGPGALAIHAEWYPDVVLMDLRMPEMDGFEAIRRMRDAGSKAAIGVLSASALVDDERQALAIGADFFLRKPYDERELFAWLARVLDAREPARPGRDSLARG
ncbi:MAG TPA: response regulator [Polyangiaceae bacterium]|nr:response regulator [Polyangiaceae bacterium]